MIFMEVNSRDWYRNIYFLICLMGCDYDFYDLRGFLIVIYLFM